MSVAKARSEYREFVEHRRTSSDCSSARNPSVSFGPRFVVSNATFMPQIYIDVRGISSGLARISGAIRCPGPQKVAVAAISVGSGETTGSAPSYSPPSSARNRNGRSRVGIRAGIAIRCFGSPPDDHNREVVRLSPAV